MPKKQLHFIANKKLFTKAMIIAVVITISDLWSKKVMFAILSEHHNYIPLTPFLNLVKVYNRGVSFGMFSNLAYAQVILAIMASIIVLVILYFLAKTKNKIIAYSFAFIIGGALGNIIDRIINGAVADFIDVYIGVYHWPAFNLADIFITIGAMLLIYDEFFNKKKK